MRIVAAAVLFLVPLALTPGFFFFYDVTPKLVALLFGTGAALLTVAWQGHGSFLSTRQRRVFVLLSAAFVVLTIVSALAAGGVAPWTGSSWRRFGADAQILIVVFSLLAGFTVTRSDAGLRWAVRGIVAAGLLCALYGIAQYFGVDPWLDARGYRAGEGPFEIVRPPSTLGHANYFAGVLLTSVLCGLAVSAAEISRPWRILSAISAAAGVAGIMLSGSRGALVGVLAGACVLAALLKINRRTITIALLCLSVVTVGFYFSPYGDRLRARMHWVHDDTTGGARLWLWRDSLRMVAAKPVLGYGPDLFGAHFPHFQSRDLSRAYPDFYHESPHNLVLDTAASTGVPGVLLLAAVLAVAAASYPSARRASPVVAAGLAAAICASVVAHQFTALVIPTALLLWITVAMLVGLAQRDGTRVTALPRSARVIFAAAAILIMVFGVRIGIADRHLAVAKNLIDAGHVDAAVQAYYAAERWRQLGIEADLYFARAFQTASAKAPDAMGKLAAAQAAYKAAVMATISSEQRANAWYHLAGLSAARNDTAGTEHALRESIGAAPVWFKPHWALARLLWMSGRAAEARAEAVTAVDLNGGKHEEVTATVRDILRSAAVAK